MMTHTIKPSPNKATRTAKKNTLTYGLFKHGLLWLSSGIKKTIYANPNARDDLKQNEGMSIYCIHGTGDRHGALSDLAERLVQGELPDNVLKVVLVQFYTFSQETRIEFFAEQLADQIKANNDRNVILFGHSRGGLIAAEFAENLAADRHIIVHGIITACTPFGGTDASVFPMTLLSESIGQMKTDSHYLRALQAQIRTDKTNRCKFYSVDQDFLVNKTSAQIKGVGDTIEIDANMHQTILVDERLVEGSDSIPGIRNWILAWARHPLPTQSAPSIPALIPLKDEIFYTSEGYSPEEINQLHDFERTVSIRYAKQLEQNKGISYENIRASLLTILETSLYQYKPTEPLYQAGQNVLLHAQTEMPPSKNFIAAKKWNISLLLAIQTLDNPWDPKRLNYLKQDAQHHTQGHAHGGKQLSGALALLASVVLVGLLVVGILSSSMLLSISLAASLLGALGGSLIYYGMASSFALKLSNLERKAQEYASSTCR